MYPRRGQTRLDDSLGRARQHGAVNANGSQRQFLNGCRKGNVLAVEGALYRVSTGDLTTDWIQWFAVCAGESSDWLAPSLGEGVMLLCPSGDPSQAVALRGFYSEDFPPLSTDPNKHVRSIATARSSNTTLQLIRSQPGCQPARSCLCRS